MPNVTHMDRAPITDFSREFSALLQGFMRERDITGKEVAEHLGRSAGFVSERTNGTRPPDTDILDAVADLARMQTRELVAELARRMLLPDAPRTPGRSADSA